MGQLSPVPGSAAHSNMLLSSSHTCQILQPRHSPLLWSCVLHTHLMCPGGARQQLWHARIGRCRYVPAGIGPALVHMLAAAAAFTAAARSARFQCNRMQ